MRKYSIEKRRRAGDWEAVVRVLEEFIRFESQHGYRAVGYPMQLKDALAALGWKDEYRKKLRVIVAAWRVQYKRRSTMMEELKALSV